MVARGEIWLAVLEPTVGSEIQKTRPCLVISPPEMLACLRTVIVAPMTTSSYPAVFRVETTFKDKKGRILLEQIRTIDKKRLVRRLGKGSSKALIHVFTVLQEMFAP